ncbi:hypothetical protein [Marinifilum sp.]|uniref:hypothetical protein n=1 Tax=Marinifilum sp. TaxID=2033137 RepID=UPI003BAB9BF5
MTTQKVNNVKQTIGFFSMTIAWTLMNILNSIYLVSEDGKADDSGVIIFWSGLFITIAWAVFIIWPISRLDHSKKLFKPQIFIPVSTVYGALTYSIIVGGIFRSFELVTMFLLQAILVGFFFGLAYSLLIRNQNLIELLNRRPLTKTIFILSPAIILGFFLWLLPLLAPSLVYRFMTDEIRQEIVAKTIPKYKVGDEIEPLKRALPGYLDHIENGSGNMSASMENFAFVIQVNCGKIIRLEYGKSQFDIDGTIYGKLQEENPCP